ncbi:hypothetical protein LTR56_024060 [Elasticomyces elasticus]|nr:hypothetical protein LTR56_024060 [Elasticomyces elasticus]KAK3666625.1 hypothetical protein LTR22_002569 [Elasticomyces elasticus]KAK4921682.1 hypothetical protein LTR49_010973 [Elasticomyces elasticus]KAK5758626.1 hypothetical protein LTS12_011330 [Elasticomyces elasticus]
MLAQEIEAIIKPIKQSIEQACNKIVAKIGSQDANKTLQQGLLSIEQACNKVVMKVGSQDSNKALEQGSLSVEQACNKIVAELRNQDANKALQRELLSIEQTCNKIVTKVGPQEVEQTLQQGFDVREQILDNARILWPILEEKRCLTVSSAHSSVQRVTPSMTVVVAGRYDAIYAVVLRHEHERTGSHNYQFIRSSDTDSAEKAMHMLLNVTMILLDQEVEEIGQIGASERMVDVAGEGCWS